MTVGREEARRIAHLARLRLEDEELERITAELNRILAHVESLRALESGHLATGGAPTVADCAPTRGDEAERPDRLEGGPGSFAPDWREGFFVVPPLPGVQAGEGA